MADPPISEWQERLRAAAAAGTALCLRGAGSKDFLGGEPAGSPLDTRASRGIVSYEPTEMVVTARCGTPLAEVESALASRGQMLAFEPPHFAAGATVGGAISAGLSGPRRPYSGSVRDLVLGVRLIDGRGEHLAFGGQVMKNVAGFDVSRLVVGAFGTLGLLTEVSLKCLPVPMAEATRVYASDAAGAVRQMNEWAGQPLPVSGTCWSDGALHVRFSGAEAAVRAALARLGGDEISAPEEFWRALRDHALPFFGGPDALWRLSLKSTAPVDPGFGPQLIEWSGAQRWVRAGDGAAERLRRFAAVHGGHATRFRGTGPRDAVFQPLAPAALALHRRIKAAFDPRGIFNPGRLYATL